MVYIQECVWFWSFTFSHGLLLHDRFLLFAKALLVHELLWKKNNAISAPTQELMHSFQVAISKGLPVAWADRHTSAWQVCLDTVPSRGDRENYSLHSHVKYISDLFHCQNRTVHGVLVPYRLVLLCLLCESFPSLLTLQLDLFALQLFHGRLIFLLGWVGGWGGVWFVLSSQTSAFSRYTVSADRKITSEALPTPTFTLLWCSSCTVCSCIRASASASLACPVEISQRTWCSVMQLMVTAYCTLKKKRCNM